MPGVDCGVKFARAIHQTAVCHERYRSIRLRVGDVRINNVMRYMNTACVTIGIIRKANARQNTLNENERYIVIPSLDSIMLFYFRRRVQRTPRTAGRHLHRHRIRIVRIVMQHVLCLHNKLVKLVAFLRMFARRPMYKSDYVGPFFTDGDKCIRSVGLRD